MKNKSRPVTAAAGGQANIAKREHQLKTMQYYKTFTYTTFILILLFSLLFVVGCQKANSSNKAKLPVAGAAKAGGPRQVRTAQVSLKSTSDVIQATGTTMALSMTKVMPLVPGLITRIPVKEGDRVKKGQVLAQLDQRGFKLGLRQARAAIEMAEVGVSAARRERDRFAKLLKGGAANQATVDQINDKVLGAQAGLKQARVALDMGKKALADTTIRSPYAGLVIKKLASLGDYATAMPPTVLYILMEVHKLELHISLPEPEMGRVKVGSVVTANFTSTDQKVPGAIARIVNNVDPMTRSFNAIVEIPNPEMTLMPGLFAQVEIKTSKPRRRLLVPKDAVVDEGGGVYAVFLLASGGKAARKTVSITESGDGMTEVVAGLKGGETLILDSSGLSDGQQVKAGTAKASTAAAPSEQLRTATPGKAEARQ